MMALTTKKGGPVMDEFGRFQRPGFSNHRYAGGLAAALQPRRLWEC